MEEREHRHHVPHHAPTHEEIAVAAYYIWLHEEEHALYHPEWNPVKPAEDNWFKAERQLQERFHLEDICEDEL